MLLTMVVCNDMFLSCAMLLFELCLWLFGACSLSVLIEHDFCFFRMYALVELFFVCFLHMLTSSMFLLLNMVAWTLFFDLFSFVHGFPKRCLCFCARFHSVFVEHDLHARSL